MEAEVKKLRDYLYILRRRKQLFFWTVLGVFLAGVVAAFVLPSTYRSSASMMVTQQEIPEEMVQTTVGALAEQRVKLLRSRVMARANLLDIVEKYNLYSEVRDEEGIGAVIRTLRSGIELEMLYGEVTGPRSGRTHEALVGFTISYMDSSPVVAQQVVREISSLYLQEDVARRSESVIQTTNFLAAEVQRVGVQVSELEAKLAEFKEKNAKSLPSAVESNLRQIDYIDRELTNNDNQIRSLESRKLYLDSELQQIGRYAVVYSSTGDRVLSPEDQLRALEAEYVAKAARYAETHPDLGKLRREMAALRAVSGGGRKPADIEASLNRQRTELAAAEARYSADHPAIKQLRRSIASLESELALVPAVTSSRRSPSTPNNPAYIRLQTEINAAQIDMDTLKRTQEELRKERAEYEKAVMLGPKVEREFLELQRDYDSHLAIYREIKDKQMQAGLAASLEQDLKGERLILADSASLPHLPEKPNRPGILFLSLIFSVTGGFGAVVLREGIDDSLYDEKALTEVLGNPPLSVVPYIEIENEHNLIFRKHTAMVTLVIALALIIGLTVLHYLQILPLDQLEWSVLRDKLR